MIRNEPVGSQDIMRILGAISRNNRAANTALITSSFFIDLVGFSLICAAVFGPTFAPFLGNGAQLRECLLAR